MARKVTGALVKSSLLETGDQENRSYMDSLCFFKVYFYYFNFALLWVYECECMCP